MPTPDSPEPAAQGPLKGIRVLDLGTIFAGPFVGAHFGELGADVIKIEPPRGDDVRRLGASKDGISMWWKVASRNKRIAAIDLTQPEGAGVVKRLARETDVLVENFRPGKLEAWGLGYDELAAINPRIVVLHISGYGRDGPYRDRPGFGTLAEAFSGYVFTNGHPDGPPTLAAFPVADTVTALIGCTAVLGALRERDASGRGQEIELNLYESLMMMMGNMVASFDQLGEVLQRRGNHSKTSVPRNAFATSDGRWVVISASTDTTASRVFRAMGRDDLANDPSLATNQQRAQRAEEIDGLVAQWIAAHTQQEALAKLLAQDVPAGPINDVEQFAADPHVIAHQSLVTLDDPDFGKLRLPNLAPRFSRTPGKVRWAGRGAIGADTRAVLREAGYADAAIDELAARKVVRLG